MLELTKPFESQLLFLITFNFCLLYGIAVSKKQKRNIPINAFKEEFTAECLNTSFHDFLDSKFWIRLYYYLLSTFSQLFYFSYFLYQYLFLLLVLGDQKNPSLQQMLLILGYPCLLQ